MSTEVEKLAAKKKAAEETAAAAATTWLTGGFWDCLVVEASSGRGCIDVQDAPVKVNPIVLGVREAQIYLPPYGQWTGFPLGGQGFLWWFALLVWHQFGDAPGQLG